MCSTTLFDGFRRGTGSVGYPQPGDTGSLIGSSSPRDLPHFGVTGYAHPGYAESLMDFGTPRELPHSGGWLLERGIPGSASRDGMGCYPLFACRHWSGLPMDLDALEGKLVSVALVPDPFGNFDKEMLDECFDKVTFFKQHFVSDLSEPVESIVSRHHRYKARKALGSVRVQVCQDPLKVLDEWVSLYAALTEKHGISGMRAFSRTVFEKQLVIPGMVVLRAERQGATVAANLFYVQGATAYDHLTASNPEGYRLGASYALKWCAILHFMGKTRWIDWGGGKGTSVDDSDGLTVFKKGWAQKTRPVYICGKILDRARYGEIVKEKGLEHSRYFPAYRDGEFS
jgi:hypothetical protein